MWPGCNICFAHRAAFVLFPLGLCGFVGRGLCPGACAVAVICCFVLAACVARRASRWCSTAKGRCKFGTQAVAIVANSHTSKPTASLDSCSTPAPARQAGWAPGDVVRIVGGVGTGSSAVVMEVAEKHCTVAQLDEGKTVALGQLWPYFHQLELESTAWRLGARVIIHGLTSKRLQHLNGALGKVGKHPKEGHLVFVTRRPSDPDAQELPQPQLRLVVVLDAPEAAGGLTSVLVEARHVLASGASAATRPKAEP